MKNIRIFYLVNVLVYLNRHVFVMGILKSSQHFTRSTLVIFIVYSSLQSHIILKVDTVATLDVTKITGSSFLFQTDFPRLLLRGMFGMNCLLSSSSISTWGTIKTKTYVYRVIQYLHNGV